MGTIRDDGSQQAMWVATADLPQGGGHPFYERLNEILCAAGFDACVEKLCAPFYARMGRPSLAPGRYVRLLLVGYVEGLDSERAIAPGAPGGLQPGGHALRVTSWNCSRGGDVSRRGRQGPIIR